MLTNNVVKFEQLGPGLSRPVLISLEAATHPNLICLKQLSLSKINEIKSFSIPKTVSKI